jgi:cell filamentation protein
VTDPYADPATGVLRNRLGITDHELLREIEAGRTAVVLARLTVEHLPGAYDLDHLARFHHAIVGRIYPWAGEVRTVAIAKTDLFCLPQHIESYAADVFGGLAREKHLRGLSRDDFVDRVTHYYAEVNAIHPFREGNGRTQRAFFGQLSRDAERPIDWTGLDGDENIAASIASLRGDNGPLQATLDGLIAPE